MTWFAHECWFCRKKWKEVEFIVGDCVYQCTTEHRLACQRRYEENQRRGIPTGRTGCR